MLSTITVVIDNFTTHIDTSHIIAVHEENRAFVIELLLFPPNHLPICPFLSPHSPLVIHLS